jgi:hypothetical protein
VLHGPGGARCAGLGDRMRCGAVLLVWMLAVACRPGEDRAVVRACQAYARTFAEAAAIRCQRGTYQANLDAFHVAAGVGPSCERVASIRDEPALRGACFTWLSGVDCSIFDDARAYLDAMPEECQGQLQLTRSEE